MLTNIKSKEAKQAKLVQEAIKYFDKDERHLKVISMDQNKLLIPQSFKFVSNFLRDILTSNTLSVDDVPTIIMPDCSSSSILHLVNILTNGFTEFSVFPEDPDDVKGILLAANVLNIDIKNLGRDKKEKKERVDTGIKVEVEDGEYNLEENDSNPDVKPKTEYFEYEHDTRKNVHPKSECVKFENSTDQHVQPKIEYFEYQDYSYNKEDVKKVETGTNLLEDPFSAKTELNGLTEPLTRQELKVTQSQSAKSEAEAYIPTITEEKSKKKDHLYKCKECKKSYTNEQSLINHQKMAHGTTPTLSYNQCTKCNLICKSDRDLMEHCEEEHKSTTYTCDLCGKSFLTEVKLWTHKRCHDLNNLIFERLRGNHNFQSLNLEL